MLVTNILSFSILHLVWMHQTRIGLSLYDVTGQGYLREPVSACINMLKYLYQSCDKTMHFLPIQDLENYILELIPTLPQVVPYVYKYISVYLKIAIINI